jgi:hypothetical protein
MPITVDALILGLTAGCKNYDPELLGYANWTGSGFVYDQLAVQVFKTGITTGNKLQTYSRKEADFTTPVGLVTTHPNFSVKSYLSAPVVCPISVTDAGANKIAFALLHGAASNPDLGTQATESTPTEYASGNTQTLPTTVDTNDLNMTKRGDIFMVITMSPGIAVTAGGYLTVKGYTGAGGSDSHTYITLASGS